MRLDGLWTQVPRGVQGTGIPTEKVAARGVVARVRILWLLHWSPRAEWEPCNPGVSSPDLSLSWGKESFQMKRLVAPKLPIYLVLG